MSARVLVCLVAISIISACGRRQVQIASSLPVPPTFIAAGTELLMRTVELIDVSAPAKDKSWAAVLARDVRTPEGDLVVGGGSPLYLGVAEANGSLHLTVRSVTARGNSYLSGSPVVASGSSVTGLEPWGTAATSADIHLSGPKIFVPGQALIAVKLSEAIALR